MMRLTLGICAIFSIALGGSTGYAQDGRSIMVDDSINSIEMIAGSTQPLEYPFSIPRLMVQSPEVIEANPISLTEILITANKPGVSALTVVDPDGNHKTINVEVKMDVRALQRTIDRHFPNCQVKVQALKSSVMLTGYVSQAGEIQNLTAVAKDYFPVNVINKLQMAKVPNVAIKVKVYEVSRTKLRDIGVDWSYFGANVDLVSSVSELISASTGTSTQGVGTLTFGVVDGSNNFQTFIQALEQHNVAKLLDEPTLVAKDGRPAEFLSGGEIPIQIQGGLGTNAVEFRPFGTKLDLVPILNGQGRMTLEVRAEVSEIDNSLSGGTGVPGFRVRRVNTGVEILPGHTLALAGDYREEVESVKRGMPKLMDHPFWGAPFRRLTETKNETELVFLITPRFIGEVEANQINVTPPGRSSASPSDSELYLDSYLEVPHCDNDCPVEDAFGAPASVQPGMGVPIVTPQMGATNQRQAVPARSSVPVTNVFRSQYYPRANHSPARSAQSSFSYPVK